jgi:hypothetical protein
MDEIEIAEGERTGKTGGLEIGEDEPVHVAPSDETLV